jgi:hypothetical protein
MQLHALQTLDGLGPQASNTVVLAVPIEIMELAHRVGEKMSANGYRSILNRAVFVAPWYPGPLAVTGVLPSQRYALSPFGTPGCWPSEWH